MNQSTPGSQDQSHRFAARSAATYGTVRLCGGGYIMVSLETMRELKLVGGQTVNPTLLAAIASKDRQRSRPLDSLPGCVTSHTNDDLIALAAAERAMDAGEIPFVVCDFDRRPVYLQVMEALQLTTGQNVDQALMQTITERNRVIANSKLQECRKERR